ncbi:MAG TPA: SDR family NAD(P)-dependent oxidoreductase, partial [Paracoccaceae bacterium]
MTLLITGANRGIGLAMARLAAARGLAVIGTHRGAAPTGPGTSAIEWQPLDVTDPAAHAALNARLSGRPLSLLVCNAGVYLDRAQRLETGFAPALWAESFAV